MADRPTFCAGMKVIVRPSRISQRPTKYIGAMGVILKQYVDRDIEAWWVKFDTKRFGLGDTAPFVTEDLEFVPDSAFNVSLHKYISEELWPIIGSR